MQEEQNPSSMQEEQNPSPQRENAQHLGRKWCILPRVIQINTKFSNFAGLYFPHFTTFRNFTNFNMLFLACGDGFCSSCPDQNLVCS
jgi:hypothetical protein